MSTQKSLPPTHSGELTSWDTCCLSEPQPTTDPHGSLTGIGDAGGHKQKRRWEKGQVAVRDEGRPLCRGNQELPSPGRKTPLRELSLQYVPTTGSRARNTGLRKVCGVTPPHSHVPRPPQRASSPESLSLPPKTELPQAEGAASR